MAPPRKKKTPATSGKRAVERYASSMNETLGFLLWDTTRAFNHVTNLMLAPFGLGIALYHFLRLLRENEGVTVRELSEMSRVRTPTTVEAVKELENRGFVRRKRNNSDARKVNVFLTPQAHALFDATLPETAEINLRGLQGLTREEEKKLKQLLRHVRANMIGERHKWTFDNPVKRKPK